MVDFFFCLKKQLYTICLFTPILTNCSSFPRKSKTVLLWKASKIKRLVHHLMVTDITIKTLHTSKPKFYKTFMALKVIPHVN